MNLKELNKKEKEIQERAAEQLALLFVTFLDEQEALKTSPEQPRRPKSDSGG